MLPLGRMSLTVKLGSSYLRASFYIVEHLSVPDILGCVLIRRHVKAIHPMDDNIELAEGDLIRLVKSWSGASPAMQTPNEGERHGCPKPPGAETILKKDPRKKFEYRKQGL